MDLDDILNLERLECTGAQARAGWYLDQDAILEAIDKLGITRKVKIKFMTSTRRSVRESGRGRSWGKGGKGWRHGTHYIRFNSHLITVDQERTAEDVSSTIWHELTHAMQAERWERETGKDINKWYWEDYKQVDGEWGNRYRGNAYEIEANRVAEENRDLLLVVFST